MTGDRAESRSLADPEHVREQYATEDNLETRRSVWQPDPDRGDMLEIALDAVTAALPPGRSMPDVLEVGSGPGVFAARLKERLPHVALLATDQSPRFVELTRERGVPAQLMDVQHLLPADDSYDVVVAMMMLYHVPDLHRGLAEVRRVLRPGGTFVAVTIGDEHVADLRLAAGGQTARQPVQQPERRGRPASALRHRRARRPPPPRGLPRPRGRPGLPRLVRRRPGHPVLRGLPGVRRPGHGLHRPLTRDSWRVSTSRCPA